MRTVIFILFVIIIIIIYFYKKDNIEGYDAKVPNITEARCGDICTQGIGCFGFGYNPQKNTCYLSKQVILGQPTSSSLYADEYQPEYAKCGKIDPIRSTEDKITDNDKRKNTIYSCQNSYRDLYQIYFIENNIMKKLKNDEIKQLYKDIPFEDYPIRAMDWPTVKKDSDPNKLYIVPEKHEFTVYEKDPREYLGTYLFPYECVENVSEKDCMQECTDNKDCEGFEWNPSYLKKIEGTNDYKIYKDVCCPKQKTTGIISRRKQYENGNYFIKKVVEKLNYTDNDIIQMKKNIYV
jgi:hypothetical protein